MSKPTTRAPKKAVEGEKKKGHKKAKKSFKSYISKVLKAATKKKITMSSKTAAVLESFVRDQFYNIANQAATLCRNNGKITLKSKDVQAAVRLTLPTDLGKTCVSEATRAMAALATAEEEDKKKKVKK